MLGNFFFQAQMLLTVLKYIKTYKVREPVSVYIYSYAPQFHDLFFVKPTRIVQVYFHGYLPYERLAAV